MSFSKMKAGLKAFERKVFLGVAALTGGGATAAIAVWQQNLNDLAVTKDQFIAATGEAETVSTSYNMVSSTLDTLKDVVASGNKEAIMDAAMRFYITLIDAHNVFAKYVPAQVRGDEKEDKDTIGQLQTILSNGLGL